MENQDGAPRSAESDNNITQNSQNGRASGSITHFSRNEKRALAVMTVIALLFGAYFLRGYLQLIAFAGVLAYLFQPLYLRFKRRWNGGVASTLTLLSALAIVIIPVGGILTLAVDQINQMINAVSDWATETDMSQLGDRILGTVNSALDQIPLVNIELTAEKLQSSVSTLAASVGDVALSFAKNSVGSIAGGVTAAIIFLYVFITFLGSGPKVVRMVKDLSPLDSDITDIYLSKIGAMAKATVGGQFIIALIQGALGAVSIYIAGIHQGFFMFVIFLTVLSIIPLGSGIVTIPMGIIVALTGNVPGGIFIVLFHILITTNVDNILRPVLVPRNAHLPPALMLLAVFSGLSMFGFLGIVFGPVVMILIVTTIKLYRVVMKGAEWDDLEDESGGRKESKNPWKRFRDWIARKRSNLDEDDGGASGSGPSGSVTLNDTGAD